MKLYKIIYILPIFLFASCDLDTTPNGLATFWNTEKEVEMGLDAAYAPLYEEEGYGRGHWWVGSASDDMVVNRADKTDDIQVCDFTATSNSSSKQYDNWKLMYQVIRRANDVMKHAPIVAMPEKNRDIMLGEANFLAAYSYFYLAKRHGGLPFYDYQKPLEINKPRETKEDTYIKIEEYLLKSIELFEKQGLWKRGAEGVGRPTLGAAYGLLAKVYAHWHGGKKYPGNENYKKAKEMAEKVINKYTLNTTNNNGFADIFSLEGEKHEEVLFNLACKEGSNQSSVTSIILLTGTKFTGGTGWYYFAPTKSLYNAYDPKDLRLKATLVTVGEPVFFHGKETIIQATDISDMNGGVMCVKYASPYNNRTDWDWYTGKDIPLLRLSDVLLIHAEAEIFLAGGGAANRTLGVPSAAASFNKVRVRAFGGDVAFAIAAPTFNDLARERRCELAYEDERHYDLVRWGIAKEVYAAATHETDPRGPRTFDPIKHNHFSIPLKEINNTGGLIVDNPLDGYSNFK